MRTCQWWSGSGAHARGGTRVEQTESPGRVQGHGRDPLLPVECQGDCVPPTCIPGGGSDVGRVTKSLLTLVGSTQLSHFSSSFFRRAPLLNTHEREQKRPSYRAELREAPATARNTSRLHAVSLAFHGEKWVLSATLISARGLRLLHAGSSTGTSPRDGPPLTGAASRSTPYLQRAGTPLNCDPQLVSPSLAAGVF